MSHQNRPFRMALCLLLQFVMWLGMGQSAVAQEVAVEASLLTCSPGTEVYSLYGHTALRVKDPAHLQDIVFNYGVFDFRRPHFTWHFILGECDYQLRAFPYAIFLQEYVDRGSSVTEQVLALSEAEATDLYHSLLANALPPYNTYRYNFLTNNCTTRARDMVERAVEGTVVYEEAPEHLTYRQMLHRYTEEYPWAEQGNDMLLGADCDTVLSDRAAQFLPERLMDYFAQAQIFDSLNNRRPLVGATTLLVEANAGRRAASVKPQPLDGFASRVTPLQAGLGVLGVMLLIALLEYAFRRMVWGVDIVAMTLQGVAGILLCFMFLFSQHPTVGSNWQVWLFNPLPLLCMPWVVRCAIRRQVCLYHYVNFLWLLLFVAASPWMPQDFSAMTLTLALSLLTRPVSYYFHYNRNDK